MASNDTLAVFTMQANEPPAAAYATLDARNGHLVLDFDAATAEAAVFRGVLPRAYAGGGLTVRLTWMASTATAGNVVWETAFERGDTDLDSDSFATAVTATGGASATSGVTTATDLAHADGAAIDGLAAGEMFRLRVRRLGADAADTMTGDAELVAVEIRET